MGKSIYLTDPAVAAAYGVAQGEFASVADDAEAAWLVGSHHGYPVDGVRAMPAAGFVHPDAPRPFVPFAPVAEQPDKPPKPDKPRARVATPAPAPAPARDDDDLSASAP